MNLKPQISIIIPTYDSERFLPQCLGSVVNQTIETKEIICVNDASPDNCIHVLKEYKHRYPELIKVIDLKKNIKTGGARNRGIEEAKGEYIAFLDSDDFIDTTIDIIGN